MAEPSPKADSRHPEVGGPPSSIRSASRDDFRAAVEQAKLEAMKELAYGASHEINNPLANIAGRAQTLLKRETDADKRKALEAIHRQAMRAHEMISDLMLFARPPKLEKQSLEVGALLESVASELRPRADDRSIALTVVAPRPPSAGPLRADADPVQLAVAVKALLENSLEAIGQSGEVAVSAAPGPAGGVVIEVRDSGPGIPEAIREHLFDPFYSGREAGRGLGFGLSKCWRIVTDHGGAVTVASPPAQGAVFTITLPEAEPPIAPLA